MSSDSALIKITKEGNPMLPNYFYNSKDNKNPTGSIEMYRIFISNFSDPTISNGFFTSPHGVKLLESLLTVLGCSLYIKANENDPIYHQLIKQAFNIIQKFFSTLSSTGRTKDTFKIYVTMIPKIEKKILYSPLKDSPIPELLTGLIHSLTSSARSTVRDIGKLVTTQGSIESARLSMVHHATINRISNLFLSPINPTVFPDLRKYCIKFIGEGTKVSEESGHNIVIIKEQMLQVVGLIKKNAGFKSLNGNQVSDINEVLYYFLQHPEVMRLFLKVIDRLERFYHDSIDDINNLKDVWIDENVTFTFTPSEGYIGGTKGRQSSVSRQLLKVTEVYPKEEIKPIAKPRGFFGQDSDSEDETPKEVIAKKGKKVKSILVTETVSNNIINVSMKSIKFLIKILNDGTNPAENQEIKKKVEEFYAAIDNDTFGDVKSNLTLDWWQSLFLDKVKSGESFILVGDTSGGKTFIALMGMRIIFNLFLNEPDARFIYMGPTPQLCVLQFANILRAYPEYSQYFGICCKLIVDVPPTAKILFGTPIEIKKYLREIKFHHNTIVNLDNLQDSMINAIDDPNSFVNNCKNVIIDEIQTWSPEYVKSLEIEQIMECKAIEEVLSSVSYQRDNKSQVIGLSATLSPESILNIKTKISSITGIPNISEIIYSHNDIGLNDLLNKDTYEPIMKKPEIIPIKIEGKTITSFKKGEVINQQVLDNSGIEMIIRDATTKGVIPISIYRESELSTIQAFKDFIAYLEKANKECTIWHSLFNRYNEDISNGASKMREESQVKKWKTILKERIDSVIHDVNLNEVVHIGNFNKLIEIYSVASNDRLSSKSPILSPELYGLLYEWLQVHKLEYPFSKDIHPYYRFSNINNSDSFFNLIDPIDNTETTLKKILMAQDADPNSNSGSIIPLIMRGISFGVSLITSSIPLGFQLEIFKFINVKSKQIGDSVPIPILFGEFGMSVGVNFSTMAVCIVRPTLMSIGPSEFNQIAGRPGRRGNANTRAPIVYTFNVENTLDFLERGKRFETLDFNVDHIRSNFFTTSEIYDFMTKLIVKFENNKDTIAQKVETASELIISGDCFKGLGGSDLLMVRKNQLAKYQLREIFDTCKNLFPRIVDSQFREMFVFLQKAEFYNLNVQIS